jgi:hypothetical protein
MDVADECRTASQQPSKPKLRPEGAPQEAIGSKTGQNIRYPVRGVLLGTMRHIKALYSGAIVKLSRSVEDPTGAAS